MSDRTGQTLGHYRIIAPIGRGGFADVYLGEHVFLKTQAAIKVLHAQLAPDVIEQFQAEARTIAHLIHPHIVRVHDFGIDNATPFLVMDYASNGTLRQRHPRGIPLTLALIVLYMKQIAGALQFAHDHRLIHRDVKPENMLLGASNEVLLSDFGIATISQTSRSLPTQDISGTIVYMAPEQVQGKARSASDQYSLAIIVYEWLTGRCPFQGSFAEIASQHIFAPPPPVRALIPSIPVEVEEVLMTALSKNPDARFARIEAFANAFEQASQMGSVVSDLPAAIAPLINPSDAPTYMPVLVQTMRPPVTPVPSATPAPPSSFNTPPTGIPVTIAVTPGIIGQPEPTPKQSGVTRRGLLIGVCATIAVVGVGNVAWYLLSRRPSGAGTNSAPTASVSTTVTPSSQTDPTGTAGPVIATPLIHQGPDKEFTASWSPDGTRIASGGIGSIIEIWDARTNTISFTLDSQASKVFRVAWSPDGTKIASSDSKGNIIIWDAMNNGNQLNSISAHPHSYANGVAWSPDNSMVVSCGGTTAQVWNAVTGDNIASYTLHKNYVNAVAWSHSGEFIVSASDDGTAQVWYALTGQQYQNYTRHTGKVLAVAWSPDDTRIVSAGNDITARIWDPASGNTYAAYTKHTELVASVDWSPDGQKIVTGSQDTTAKVWSAADGITIYTFPGHSYEVEGVAWAFDSARVASASDDRTVQVWQIS
ncbi:MAG TPA: protein kinase [Ktedonobacteraceae bacterium]|nr:protein kinase [Ktedonobacteraceae bacterium]